MSLNSRSVQASSLFLSPVSATRGSEVLLASPPSCSCLFAEIKKTENKSLADVCLFSPPHGNCYSLFGFVDHSIPRSCCQAFLPLAWGKLSAIRYIALDATVCRFARRHRARVPGFLRDEKGKTGTVSPTPRQFAD